MLGRSKRKRTLWLAAAGAVAAIAAVVGFWGRDRAPADESLEDRYLRLANECRTRHRDAPWVTVEDYLADGQRDRIVLVDNRAARERAVSYIPGSITRAEFERDAGQYRDRPVVVYCTVGCRSGRYATKLRKRGFDARNLGGGVLAWAFADQRFIGPDGADTRRVHVYGRRWNALPDGFEPVW